MPYRPWPTSPPRLAAWERNKGTTVTRERNNSSGAAVEDSGGGRGKAHSRVYVQSCIGTQNYITALPPTIITRYHIRDKTGTPRYQSLWPCGHWRFVRIQQSRFDTARLLQLAST
ncbi:hypothetical protein OsJ_05090 [Oryza sativa Japonica Group]|uniref:Uncharacterized protein n=1 Tax=Oryza sativa subsp. japonica TaxID=39947 RepID=B9F230_ORYSJ|nr:hypothetical protein OsJ_05090 [Oryza sativa Japonica Group]